MQAVTEFKSIKVLMVDDTVDIAMLFRRLIDSQQDMSCVGLLHDAKQLEIEDERLQPDVVVLDLSMPGKPPINALRELSSKAEQPRVLAFSGYDDPSTKQKVFEAGAWGLASKNGDPRDVLEAIRQVHRGETAL
jgi:DNA-binding NarL/FixJ family response regulator